MHAEESHQAAKVLLDSGFLGFSAAQSYCTMFYLTEALLHSKGLQFSSHSAVIAAFGKEFSKTAVLDPRYHRRIIIAEGRCEMGIMARKAASRTRKRRNHMNGRMNFLRL